MEKYVVIFMWLNLHMVMCELYMLMCHIFGLWQEHQ
jgi:hypothetical protein